MGAEFYTDIFGRAGGGVEFLLGPFNPHETMKRVGGDDREMLV